MVTVTGTENFLMAAALAEGETVLENAAMEPEITDLAEMLIKMGAKIEGHGTSRITIQGVESLARLRAIAVVADRIEAGTFLCAVAATGGEAVSAPCAAPTIWVPSSTSCRTRACKCRRKSGIRRGQSRPALKAQSFRTTEYPGFPTDMQAQFMALNLVAEGTSVVTETIFENRFMHVNEMLRLGAHIATDGRVATVEGVHALSGATGDGYRSARLGQPGDCRAGGQGRNPGRPHLSPGPWL